MKHRAWIMFCWLLCMVFQPYTMLASSQNDVRLVLKQKALKVALNEVEKQTTYSFAYNHDVVDEQLLITVDIASNDINQILSELLNETNYKYKIYDERIILSLDQSKMNSIQQPGDIVIKGKVTDEKGEPIPFCHILIEGTTTGAMTDIDGNYTIKYQKAPFTLIYSCIGFSNQKKIYETSMTSNITMKVEGFDVDEVIVTGYQKIDRKLFTGAADRLKGEDAKVDGMVDVGRMLEGKSAGVAVQNVSGTFGAAPKITIRGASSIYGDQKPLWVVDGVVLEDIVNVSADELSSGDAETLISSSVAGINADDIESFQVLKDASATALYGARAMNGVIVITTKNGKNGKTRINYTSNYTLKRKPSYDQYDVLNSRDQMSVYLEMQDKGWLNHADLSNNADGGVFLRMYDMINQYDPNTGFGLENTPEARAVFLQDYEMANTDWFNLLFNNSLAQEHSVSLSTGSEKSQTYVSVSYYNDEGWTKNNAVDRYTGNFKTTISLNEKLKVGFNMVGSIREQTSPGTTARVDDVFEGAYRRDFDINPFSYALNTSRVMRAYDNNGNLEFYKRSFAPFNILHELDHNKLELNVLDLKLQGDIDYRLNKDITYNFVGSLRYVKSTREHMIHENSNTAQAYRMDINSTIRERNKLLYEDSDNPNAEPVVVLPKGGFYNRYENKLVNYYFRNTINYNKTINENNIVNILLGQELKYADRQEFYNNGPGYQYNAGGVPFIDYRYYKQALEMNKDVYYMGWNYDRFVAFFLNGGYTYKGKYTVNGTIRMDGSNQLGQKKSARWLPTWNISGSWNVSEEDFLNDNDVISRLTLRATYGLTASMGNAKNSTLILYSGVTERPYLSEKEGHIQISDLENSELTWEKQYETNIGFNLGLFQNKVSVTADFYKRDGFDLIGLIATSGIGGQKYKYGNYADLKTKGYELSIFTKNVNNKSFSWSTDFTFAQNTNEITTLKEMPRVFDLINNSGGPKLNGPVRGLYSIPFAGLNQYGIPTFYGPDGEVTTKINMQSYDIDYLKYEGTIDPTITGGVNNTFKYKRLKLGVFVSFAAGNKIRLNPVFKNRYSDLDAMTEDFKNRWVMFGDEKKTDIPVILTKRQENELNNDRPYSYFNFSDRRVADGDFIKLKNVSLSYDIPENLTNKVGINNASLKLQGTNLMLLHSDDKLNGQDPEFYSSGGVALPQAQQYTLTLKVQF